MAARSRSRSPSGAAKRTASSGEPPSNSHVVSMTMQNGRVLFPPARCQGRTRLGLAVAAPMCIGHGQLRPGRHLVRITYLWTFMRIAW
jgi:hypothetical protein